MATIARWGAKALVSLLDDFEFARLHLRRLPELARAAGVTWYHIPQAFAVLPDSDFDRLWTPISLRLHELLRSGGKVAIHCRDGRNRSALVAARLLIELGSPPLDAINRVRAARPGTLDTSEVETYLRTRVHPFKPEELMQLALLAEEESEAGEESTPPERRTQLRVASRLRRS
jgi:ADP-ribosyl-[dinitrogen reductase] hydrolase